MCQSCKKKRCTENFKKSQSIELQTKFFREINVEWDKFYMGPPISFNTSSYGIVVKNNAGSIISIELDSYIVEYKKARLQLIETVQKKIMMSLKHSFITTIFFKLLIGIQPWN